VDLGIAGKTALVTASSKGLGRASAEALAAEGARVTICARGAAALADAEQSLVKSGAEVLAIQADVTEPATPARLVDETVARFGGLDILVANAGGPPPGRSLEVDDAALLAALNANLLTSIRLVRESVPHMRAAGWGRVCCITSYVIKQPAPILSLSNVARTGLWAWAKTAAADLIGEGITLNLTCPGPHATERMRELGGGGGGRMADPADFGKVVAFLCSDAARDVSGVALQVDGAATTALA